MCSGRIDPLFVLSGLKSGFDSVFVSGWHIGECHYLDGNIYAANRMDVVQYLMDISCIGSDRVQLRWVSSAEGKLFADYVTEISDLTRNLGPFDRNKFELQLGAVEQTLSSARIRWLMGLTRQLTEQGNVYQEKLEKENYQKVIYRATEEEYQKALVLEALKETPRSVRGISEKTGLPVYTVSLRLNELERQGQAELSGYEGSTPKFIGLAV
jgi:F420-non-reducing hydrogenase iron-sulfur subunit